MRRGFVLGALLVFSPVAVFAQSAIGGVVRDATGGNLPGVAVEASSPALIEGVRVATTNDAGQYSIENLRPGLYTVTFTLEGFSTVRREGIELSADFRAPVNIEMRVGALAETITVTGQTPVVDVQSTQRREVLSRELLDTLPQGRSFQAVGSMLPSVTMGRFDVGGSTGMQMSNLRAYGSLATDQTMSIDGISANTPFSDGGNVGLIHNDGAYEEMVYQVSGGTAEERTAGVHINMIPKQGGNQLKGDSLFLFANTGLQSSNYTDDLKNRGLARPAALYRLWDANANLGGPIKRDRLWFFVSVRNHSYNSYLANMVLPNGVQARDDNIIESYTSRVTYQLGNRTKLTAMYDLLPKFVKYYAIAEGGFDPQAAQVQNSNGNVQWQTKGTFTLSSKVLIEAGLGRSGIQRGIGYQPEVELATCFTSFANCPAGTNYGDISKRDVILQRRWDAAFETVLDEHVRHHFATSLSYVTGSHNVKVGLAGSTGFWHVYRTTNGDLVQVYRNGVPDSVEVRNTPLDGNGPRMWEFGPFIQDTWTLKRWTLNAGLRFDSLDGYLPAHTAAAGRFVPERHFERIDGLPNWSDWGPRVGAVYDLFGNAKTAVKGSFGRYVQNAYVDYPERYDPLVPSLDTRTWSDTNRDDIAQENEIGPPTNATFGVRRNRNPDPDIQRPWQMFYSAGVQHEVLPGMALTMSYNRRNFYSKYFIDNLATTDADWALLTIPDPRGNGQTLPVYNLNVSKRGLINESDTNSNVNTERYTGFDATVTGRLPNGARFLGGTSTGRSTIVTCEVEDPNSLRFCDQTQHDLPWITTFKGSGTYPLPYGIQVSGVFQSVAGAEVPITYVVNRTIVPTLTQTSVNVQLNEPGSEYLERVNQLDVSLAKTFRRGRMAITPQLDLFNALNANPVLGQVNTFGPAFGTPIQVQVARLLRLGLKMVF